ncbi:hypothetical protein [Actinomadura litoris]|uniref:hypothetical protein n=1 Tax=Actinomadura litoris TaxID=2678616 RepID=UPI001FA70FA2|nr:hypothetical protein [Actinomadura litoris]
MTDSPAKQNPAQQSRGRHAKPPSALSIRWRRLAGGSPGGSRRRRASLAGAGAATLALATGLVVFGGVPGLPGGGAEAPRAEVAAHTGRPAPATAGVRPESVEDPDEVPEAVPYFESRDPEKKIARHVTDVRRSGDFLRVYTDLGESDENSKPALSLCEWTTQFLKDGGDDDPRVFVHGKSSDNGSVVLANKQSDKDDCEVPETR